MSSEMDNVCDEIGRLADSLDAGLHATRLGLPPAIHIEGMGGIMREVRDKLAAIVKRETGDDPWADNPLEG